MSKLLIAKDAAEKAWSVELARTESRSREAWRFAVVTMVVLGFQVRDLKALVESPSPWVKILSYLSLAALGGAACLAIYVLQLNGHSHYPRGQKLWENLKPETVTDEAAEEALVLLLLQTREQNAKLNDARTRILRWCGWLFLGGLLLVAGSQLLEALADWT
jgi:hypothetical protein